MACIYVCWTLHAENRCDHQLHDVHQKASQAAAHTQLLTSCLQLHSAAHHLQTASVCMARQLVYVNLTLSDSMVGTKLGDGPMCSLWSVAQGPDIQSIDVISSIDMHAGHFLHYQHRL